MPTIDADAHVIETEETWQYMDDEYARHKVRMVVSNDPALSVRERGYWVMDGQFRATRLFDDEKTYTPAAAREMRDIEGRLRHMDELGVDIAVLYPTTLLGGVATTRCSEYGTGTFVGVHQVFVGVWGACRAEALPELVEGTAGRRGRTTPLTTGPCPSCDAFEGLKQRPNTPVHRSQIPRGTPQVCKNWHTFDTHHPRR